MGTVDLKDTLCCPDCYGSVSSHGEGLVRNNCNRYYPVEDGIYSMLPSKLEDRRDENDPAYHRWLELYPEVLKIIFIKKGY